MSSLLAILGGAPVVTVSTPHFTWPPITDRDREAVAAQLETAVSIPDRSGIVADLEDALASRLGVRHVVTYCTGTAALHSMFAAAGIGPGDEVIVPAYTFHATASPLFSLGAHPVLADVDPVLGMLDVTDAERRITARTKAIIAVHLWGMPADMDRIAELAHRHRLTLLEDGSHAHGARLNGREAGTFGAAAAFSMNGPKPLSAGEGGFVATDDTELYYKLLIHGHYSKRCRTEIPADHPLADYAVTGMGLKLRIHPLAAALALSQLARLDEYLAGRTHIAQRMLTALGNTLGIEPPPIPPGAAPAWYALALRYRPEQLGGLSIERFMAALHAEGATAADLPGSTCALNSHPLFQYPERLFDGYADYPGYAPGDFPIARAVAASTLKLPVWHREQDVPLADAYAEAIAKVAASHKDLL